MEPVGAVVFAALVLVYGIFSKTLGARSITAPIVFVAAGVVLGGEGLGRVDVDFDAEGLRILAEVTLGLVLFTDAIRIDLPVLRRQLRLPARLLGIGLPLTIALGGLAAALLFPELPVVEAALIGAILAPTDAALGQAVVTDRRIPVRIRQALNVESGLNDGITLPVVTVLSTVAAAEMATGPSGWVALAAREVGFGAIAGVAAGIAGGVLIRNASRRGLIDGVFRQLSALAVAVLAFAGAEMVGGNAFIGTFTAGLAFGWAARKECEHVQDFTEDLGQLLAVLTFFFFGSSLAGPALELVTWQIVVYAALSLTLVRMVPVAVALAGTGLRRATVAFMGWFGPRGLASILFGLLIVDEAGFPGVEMILLVVTWTVMLSVLLHGLTSVPLAGRYAASMAVTASPAESEPVDEMAVRTFTMDFRTEA